MYKKIIFILLISVLISTTVLAWEDCPIGEVTCEGECGLFVDADNNGICDRSQSVPEEKSGDLAQAEITEELHDLISGQELKTKTVSEVAEIYEIDKDQYAEKLYEYLGVKINPEDSFQLLHDNYRLEPSVAKDIAVAISLGGENMLEPTQKQGGMVYHFLPISFLLTLLYLTSHVLSQKKIISIVNHRKFWNILLLITFLISAIFGILLVIRINSGKITPLRFNVLFWHVEMGIAMTAISIFHILWHWAYFKNLFNIKK